MRNIIFIIGINGSGKSTIAERLSEKLGTSFFEGSKILMNHFGLLPGDYSSLREIPLHDQLVGNAAVLKKINEKNVRTIVVNHIMLTINGKSEPFLGDWFNDGLILFHLWNDPEVILKRIEEEGRDRKLFSDFYSSYEQKVNFLKHIQERSIDSAKLISEKYTIPLVLVKNDSVERSVQEIIKTLQ